MSFWYPGSWSQGCHQGWGTSCGILGSLAVAEGGGQEPLTVIQGNWRVKSVHEHNTYLLLKKKHSPDFRRLVYGCSLPLTLKTRGSPVLYFHIYSLQVMCLKREKPNMVSAVQVILLLSQLTTSPRQTGSVSQPLRQHDCFSHSNC